MKLYAVSDGPPSLAVRMALKALDVPFELIGVNFNAGEHLTDDYAKVYWRKFNLKRMNCKIIFFKIYSWTLKRKFQSWMMTVSCWAKVWLFCKWVGRSISVNFQLKKLSFLVYLWQVRPWFTIVSKRPQTPCTCKPTFELQFGIFLPIRFSVCHGSHFLRLSEKCWRTKETPPRLGSIWRVLKTGGQTICCWRWGHHCGFSLSDQCNVFGSHQFPIRQVHKDQGMVR